MRYHSHNCIFDVLSNFRLIVKKDEKNRINNIYEANKLDYFNKYKFFPHNYSLRIVRDVSFELMPGKFYISEELVQRDYTLEEITLEGIIEPEAIPEDKVDLIEPEGKNPYLEILKEWYREIYGEDISN